jgi:cell division protein FtsZ
MGIRQLSRRRKKLKIDKHLEDILQKRKTQIRVIGSGGAGCNTISRLNEIGIYGAQTIAINTDAQDLLFTNADQKVLIGKETTKGLGCGADPIKGAEATRESKEELEKVLKGADLVFLTCGLGGGTGTGSLPILAEMAKKIGALTVAIVTLPFAMEGYQRRQNASEGLKKLEPLVDTLIVIPNDKLLEIAPKLSLLEAFNLADEILANALKGVTEIVTKPGLVNLDFADIKAIMENGGLAMIGLGESSTENRAYEAVQRALSNPLLTVDIKNGSASLVNIVSGPDITAKEHQEIVETITSQLSPEARIIWGAQIEPELGDMVRVLLIVTGLTSPELLPLIEQRRKRVGEVLGLEFI